MRVLLLNSRLSERGGADRWLLGILARLRGQVETLLAVGYEERIFPAAERARVGPSVRIKGLDGRGLGSASPAAAVRLRALIGEFAPDVVHANDLTDPELLAVVAASGRGVQTVQDHRFFCPGRGKVDLEDRICDDPIGESCLRCFDEERYGQRVLELTRRRLRALQRMSRISVLSRYMADELVVAGVGPERIVRVPPFVDNLEFHRTADAAAGEYHLMAGRLSSHKGIHTALAAARSLAGELPLVVAGDGPLVDAVRAASRSPGSRVRFVGWAGREALAGLIDGARSLWLPSLWAEPFGIAGLEALARGVPVIASDVGGVREWLADGKNGLLVQAGSPTALARAADCLAGDPSLAARLGQSGRERVESDFDPAASVRKLRSLYEDVTRAGVLHTSLRGSTNAPRSEGDGVG